MQIVKPSFEIMTPLNEEEIMSHIEKCGRVAYKSEGKITSNSAGKFVHSIINRGHGSVIEHFNISVRFICDRGVTHELVRHRLVSYTQESTRYCNYTQKGVIFIEPPFWEKESQEYNTWVFAMQKAEDSYNALIEQGCSPQQARSVLPNSLKTEIIATTNIREWRHILKLRTSKNAHPQMRELMLPLLGELIHQLPVLFSNGGETL